MCPACMATVALIAAGATTTGGLAALVVTRLCAKVSADTGADKVDPVTQGEGDQHESSESRGAR